MTETYPHGAPVFDFPKPVQPQIPLPPRFDDSCDRCEKPMERMPSIYCSEVKPFATFQCVECKVRLLLYEAPGAPNDPFFVWTGDPSIINRKDLEQRLKERADKEARDAARHAAAT